MELLPLFLDEDGGSDQLRDCEPSGEQSNVTLIGGLENRIVRWTFSELLENELADDILITTA